MEYFSYNLDPDIRKKTQKTWMSKYDAEFYNQASLDYDLLPKHTIIYQSMKVWHLLCNFISLFLSSCLSIGKNLSWVPV